MPVTLTDALAEELGELWEDDPLELGGYTYTLYEVSEEINDHKYVHWDRIYKRNDGKYFVQSCSKSGSYWSDYEFEYGTELYEVRQVTVSVVQWKNV